MHTILVKTVTLINTINEAIFAPADKLIESLPLSDWLIDALIDSIHMLPFLFFIFVFIELVEYFYSNKMKKLAEYSDRVGPLAGSLAASFPQCGFSVIASTLYTKRLITKGTLLAVYLSTSDEAIPVILSDPAKLTLVVPLLLTKIVIAIIAGYTIDFVIDKTKDTSVSIKHDEEEITETEYVLKSFDLSEFAGEKIYIAIKATSEKNQYYLYIDEFEVTTCPRPSEIAIAHEDNALTSSSAKIAFTSSANDNTVEYRAEGSDAWTVLTNQPSPVALPDLSPNTSYEVRIKAICGQGDESAYSSIMTFSTPAA